MSYYRFLLSLVGIVLNLFWKPKYKGLANIPAKGPIVLCSNHINAVDPFLIAYGLKREIYFLAKEELFRKPLLRHFLYRTGMIPVKRGQTDRQAIRTVLEQLSEGKMIGVFPEGTRSTDTELLDFHDGAVYFALKSGASLVPTAIVGNYQKGKAMQVVFGKTIPVEKTIKIDREQMHSITQHLAIEIRALKGVAHGD